MVMVARKMILEYWLSAEAFDGPLETPCMFLPNRPGKNGYVLIRAGGKVSNAHRAIYLELVGPVPADLDLDHLCRNRACVNVFEHLEPVTRKVNLLRGKGLPARWAARTHCSKGHELSGRNLLTYRTKGRQCRVCENEQQRTKYQKRRSPCQ